MMNAEQLEIFKTSIIAAVDYHLANGGKLAVGAFGSGNCLCPIACLAPKRYPQSYLDSLGRVLGFPVSNLEMWAFIDGIDNNNISDKYDSVSEVFQFGRDMRDKYITSSKE